MKKIGIMGGTFNPIHMGHLIIAEKAREQAALDKILFMPSGIPYMKDCRQVLPGEIRTQMTELAIRSNPFFSVSTMEVDRKGRTYTYETLESGCGILFYSRRRQPVESRGVEASRTDFRRLSHSGGGTGREVNGRHGKTGAASERNI